MIYSNNLQVLPTKGCAFIRFAELDAAIQAHATMHGAIVHGQQIKIGWGKVTHIILHLDTSNRNNLG